MACGDRYAHLIVTVSGLSPANPYDRVPTTSDLEEWQQRAEELAFVVEDFFDALRPIETNNTRWNVLVDRQNKMLADFEALRSPWLSVNWSADIGAAIDVCKQAACILELVEDRLAELGSQAPEIPAAPKPTDKPEDIVDLAAGATTTIVIGAVVIVGLIVWARSR